MDQIVEEVARLQGVTDYRAFTELPGVLRDPSRMHPKQIRRKARSRGISLSADENTLYGSVQAVFNAKPDLAITFDDTILVYEAKFTQHFDSEQIQRTREIASIWAGLLYQDLGFSVAPDVSVSTMGPKCYGAQVSWEWILDLSQQICPVEDRTYRAIENAVNRIDNQVAR